MVNICKYPIHYLGFIHPRWCRISSINSTKFLLGSNRFNQFDHKKSRDKPLDSPTAGSRGCRLATALACNKNPVSLLKKQTNLKSLEIKQFHTSTSLIRKHPKSLSFYHTRFLSTPDRHLVPHFHSQAAMERSPVLIYSQTFVENTSIIISQLVYLWKFSKKNTSWKQSIGYCLEIFPKIWVRAETYTSNRVGESRIWKWHSKTVPVGAVEGHDWHHRGHQCVASPGRSDRVVPESYQQWGM